MEPVVECDICLEDVDAAGVRPICKTCPKTTCGACYSQIFGMELEKRKCPFCRGELRG
jgi:hypothetical protein